MPWISRGELAELRSDSRERRALLRSCDQYEALLREVAEKATGIYPEWEPEFREGYALGWEWDFSRFLSSKEGR